MTSIPRIFITGFMAAGKTTLARSLAQRMGCRMVDLDHFIFERHGRAPQQIIDDDGEARFREIETSALRLVLEETDATVVALGGGAWTMLASRTLIAEHEGFTVWLDTPFELCWQRIRSGSGDVRPLARDREKAERLYDERRSLYELADLRVEARRGRSAEDMAAEIAHALLHRRTKM